MLAGFGQGTQRAGWPPMEAPVQTPCRDSASAADMDTYYDVCERCHQAPETPAQVDTLLRQQQEALRDVPLGSDMAQLVRLLHQPKPYTLCRTFPAPYNAYFKPDRPELWGGRPDKERYVIYALCDQCFALPDKVRCVEAHFQAALGKRRN